MKKLVAALLAGVMVFSLAACGEKEEDFDAKGYVEGVLDATYHGDYKAHAEDVGESEEDIKKELEDNNIQVAKDALAQSGLTATDDEIEAYVAMIEDGATVKTFYKEEGVIRLQPENEFMEPIIVQDVMILGKVFVAIRFFK